MLSPFLFTLVVDWIMRTSTEGRREWHTVDIVVIA